MIGYLKEMIRWPLAQAGFEIRRVGVLASSYPDFMTVASEIGGRTLVPKDRLYVLHQFARYAARLDGAAAELGVYRGGTARLLSQTLGNKPLLLFDTFAGMPATSAAVDGHEEGDFADTSLAAVKEFLNDCKNVEFLPGRFPESATGKEGFRFALVNVDCDIYHSTRDALEWFYPRLVPAGALVIDDYGSPQCAGVKRAVDEFSMKIGNRPMQFAANQCVLIKVGESDEAAIKH